MNVCHVCGPNVARPLLDLGPQPLCNRYLHTPEEEEYRHPVALSVCEACGLVQIERPMPAVEMHPRFDWIIYNEPEGHLDTVADAIAALPGIGPDSTICGFTYKDETTLRRLRERSLAKFWSVSMGDDLGVFTSGAGIESVQDRISPEVATEMVKRHGRPDIVLIRHVLEHSHQIHRVAEGLKQLVSPNGYIVFEVPDVQRALQSRDYSTIWEEHIFYFTPETFQHALEKLGFEIVWYESFPYTLEDSLVAIVRPRNAIAPGNSGSNDSALRKELRRAFAFGSEYAARCERYQKFFAEHRMQNGKIALLGAGHMSCALINLLGLESLVDYIIDDDPRKAGLFMPGSRLPIRDSRVLLEHGVKLCCMSVRPEIEDKVVERHRNWVDQGGTFASIFPGSRYALPI